MVCAPLQAAEKLTEAASTMSSQPIALQLRYLQTLSEIAVEQNSTILFPVPIDILASFMQAVTAPPAPLPDTDPARD